MQLVKSGSTITSVLPSLNKQTRSMSDYCIPKINQAVIIEVTVIKQEFIFI